MSTFTWVAAVLVGVISVARTARLLIHDDFPPLMWARARVLARFPEDDRGEVSRWSKIIECHYCLTPYLSAGMLAWAWLADLNTTWWVINGVWAGSYVAAVFVSYDQPE